MAALLSGFVCLSVGARAAGTVTTQLPGPTAMILTTDQLVTGDDCFFVATGITDGDLMSGVRYRSGGCTTDSLVPTLSRDSTTLPQRSKRWVVTWSLVLLGVAPPASVHPSA